MPMSSEHSIDIKTTPSLWRTQVEGRATIGKWLRSTMTVHQTHSTHQTMMTIIQISLTMTSQMTMWTNTAITRTCSMPCKSCTEHDGRAKSGKSMLTVAVRTHITCLPCLVQPHMLNHARSDSASRPIRAISQVRAVLRPCDELHHEATWLQPELHLWTGSGIDRKYRKRKDLRVEKGNTCKGWGQNLRIWVSITWLFIWRSRHTSHMFTSSKWGRQTQQSIR